MHVVDLNLDVRKPSADGIFVRVYQGDVEAVVVRADIFDGGEPYPLDGMQARFEAVKPDGTWVREIATVKSHNIIEYVLPPQIGSAEGLIDNACFRLLRDGGQDSAGPFAIEVLPSVDGAAGDESGSYCPELDSLMGEMRQLITDGGAKDYTALIGKPSIEGRTLEGDIKLAELGVTKGSNKGIEAMFNETYRKA